MLMKGAGKVNKSTLCRKFVIKLYAALNSFIDISAIPKHVLFNGLSNET